MADFRITCIKSVLLYYAGYLKINSLLKTETVSLETLGVMIVVVRYLRLDIFVKIYFVSPRLSKL